MACWRRARIVEWLVLLVPVGGVLLMGWLVARQTCSLVPGPPIDVAAPGGEPERPPAGGAS